VGRGLVDELGDEDDGRQNAGHEAHRPDHDVQVGQRHHHLLVKFLQSHPPITI